MCLGKQMDRKILICRTISMQAERHAQNENYDLPEGKKPQMIAHHPPKKSGKSRGAWATQAGESPRQCQSRCCRPGAARDAKSLPRGPGAGQLLGGKSCL